MLRLHGLGWGTRRIAAGLGCDREAVQRHVAAGGWAAYQGPGRPGVLAGHEVWVAERFRRHRGNADVVRQELAGGLAETRRVCGWGIQVSLRAVERSVAHLRRELAAEALATVSPKRAAFAAGFETPPGRQLQIGFGEAGASIKGEGRGKLHLFVATLGYSRRVYVRAFRHERQPAWLDGIEGAFRHFGGVPAELLMDNAKALVAQHDAATRVEPRGSPDEVVFNDRLHGFARRWGVRPVACVPFRARTKGKDERGVGCVKGNAIAGRSFASWSALEAHLAWWMREVADPLGALLRSMRVHGTTGEVPAARFAREERQALRPLDGRPAFRQMRELTRRVQVEPKGSPENDACVDVDTSRCSVPWRLIGAQVSVVVGNGAVRVHHAGAEAACHVQRRGRRERAVDRAHLHGVLARGPDAPGQPGHAPATPDAALPGTDLLRPLAEHEQVAGSGW